MTQKAITTQHVSKIFEVYANPNYSMADMLSDMTKKLGLTYAQIKSIVWFELPNHMYQDVPPEQFKAVRGRRRKPRSIPISESRKVEVEDRSRLDILRDALKAYEAWQQAKQEALDLGMDEKALKAWIQLSSDLEIVEETQ